MNRSWGETCVVVLVAPAFIALAIVLAWLLLLALPAAAQDTVSLATTGYGNPLSPAQITSTQHNYAPTGCARYIVWRLSSDAARSITGISAATCAPAPGLARMRVLVNDGAHTITLEDDDAGSSEANRFTFAADVAIPAGQAAAIVYDPTEVRWRFIGLETAGGSGEANTASNLGGGLANWDTKVGVDLRFNTFSAADFDLAANLLTIDDAKWSKDSEEDDVPEAGDFGALSATAPITQSGGTISTSMATARLIGRTTAGTGVMEQITPDATLNLAAGALGVVDVTCTGCLGTTEIAALDAGDTTTGVFGDGQVDGSLEAGEVVATETDEAACSWEAGSSLIECDNSITDTTINEPVFGAGSASANTWPKFTAGTVLTTAEDGAIEADADAWYGTTDAGNRGVLGIGHIIRAASDQTLTNTTSAQSIFDSPANGQITLETGTYLFEGMLQFTGLSGTSGNMQILFAGTGTFADWNWKTCGIDATMATIAADLCAYHNTNASAASVVTAQTATVLRLSIEGSVEVTGAGTMIPQLDLVTGAAGTLESGSYFTLRRVGSTAMTSVGQWD